MPRLPGVVVGVMVGVTVLGVCALAVPVWPVAAGLVSTEIHVDRKTPKKTPTPPPTPTLTPTPLPTATAAVAVAAAAPTATLTPTPSPTPSPTATPAAGKKNKKAKQVSDSAKKEKKNHDNTVTVGRGTLDPIPALPRGETVEIKGTALRSGEVCSLQMFYSDKAARTIRDVVPDEHKRCVFSVTVPDRPGAVGEGKALMILTKETSGKKSGEARQTFTVK
ncbi:MAG: hypothetical protein IT306_01890 [Chloroflexi bacterium]|nr:hypothetical protein [Chloroflexota bacterium]